jgi:hypothetical protein
MIAASTCLDFKPARTPPPSGTLVTEIFAPRATFCTQKSVSEPICVTPTVLPLRSASDLIGEPEGTMMYQPDGRTGA